MSDSRRAMDIETALRWAFREELPKSAVRYNVSASGPARPGPGWGRVESYAQLLTVIDANRYGVVPDAWSLSEPHQDAIRIGEAVEALDHLEVEIPADWSPLDDMGDLGPAVQDCVAKVVAADMVVSQTGLLSLRTAVSVLVRKYALLGRGLCPEWQCDRPTIKFVSANGKPRWFVRRTLSYVDEASGKLITHEVESEGYNHRSKRPLPDAYRKPYLSPDPSLAILGRAEYEVWHCALHQLTAQLEHRLDTIRVTPFERSPRPWLQPDNVPSIWRDLETVASPPKVRPKRSRNRPRAA